MPLLLKLRDLGGCCRLTRRLLYRLGRIESRSYIRRERDYSQGCYISGAVSFDKAACNVRPLAQHNPKIPCN
jgi:hypothetical protein